jgi:hypothetical protein
MQQAEIEPRACRACAGRLRRVRHVPLKSLEGQRIFECQNCGELTMTAPQPSGATRSAETRARLLNLL